MVLNKEINFAILKMFRPIFKLEKIQEIKVDKANLVQMGILLKFKVDQIKQICFYIISSDRHNIFKPD